MLTVIGTAKSRAFRVLWMLEELGLPYTHHPALPQDAVIRAAHPRGKVPVLVLEDGEVLTDSAAIITWLADSAGRLTAAPGTLERARQDAVTHMLLDEFDAALWAAGKHSFALPAERRVPAIKDTLRWEVSRSQHALAERLGDNAFLTGEALTIPDIIAGHCLLWMGFARFQIENPTLADYLTRLQARPAWQAAVAQG